MKEMGFYRGINFGGWMSQCDYSEERLDSYITQQDFERIASWGLDHVRIPIDYNILENDDGTYKESGFERIENAIKTAQKYGLKVILDLHKTAGFSFDNYSENEHGFFESDKYQERFYLLWEQLAKRFGRYCNDVAFELLNEVTDKEYITVWNNVTEKCIARIRRFAPDTIILVGSYWHNSPVSVKDLDKPFDDKVVYNMHCYSPFEFTHQGAPWAEAIDQTKRVSFESSGTTEAQFEQEFASAIEKARSEGTTLYCGEYGVINKASPKDILEWYKVINRVFEKYGIARAAWCYKQMNFGIADSYMDDVRDELIEYL